jgi:HTH-type transcriptional regulator/antitoxin MqsA
MMAETRIHPVTGKLLKRDIRPFMVEYGSMARQVELPGWYPDDDGDAVHSGLDMAQVDEVFLELRAAYSAHVREVRKSLGLTQEEAGEIIGGGKRAFQKYESGKAPPSDAAVGLIEILSRQPKAIEVLKEIRRKPGAGKLGKRAGHKRRERAAA